MLLALALRHPRGRKLPAAILLVPVWAGTGLLAPIALGLPVGVVVQAIAGGSPAPVHNGLHGWVYGVVYGGFTVQAAALSTAFLLHVRLRWAHLLALPLPALGGTGTRVRVLAGAGAAATGVYAAANLAWAVASEPAAPAGFETIAQRSLLVSDGLLGLAGAAGVLLPVCARAALERLAGGERDLARLAADVGFADQSHLSRVVRAETGHTPGALRAALGG